MAYTINLTNGTVLTTIADGTVDNTTSSLTLIGKNYAGYGTFLNDNLVHLLENGSNSTAPTTPLTGQLWWDTAGNLKVFTGSAFKTISTMATSSSQPSNGVTGSAWWDTANQQLNIYNGVSWVLIGPAFTSNTGTSGTIVGTILDANASSHVAVNVYVSNTLVGIISKDSTYTPQSSIAGFTQVNPGFNLTTAIANVAFWGSATNTNQLGSVSYTSYARTDIPVTFANTVTATGNISATNLIGTSIVGNTASISGAATVGSLTSAGNVAGDQISGSILNILGPITAGGRIFAPSANITGNVVATYFVGTAIQANYADLAERFEADAAYPPGTVLSMGGVAEVTEATDELSEDVFGVVSTKAAYLMNANAGGDDTHPQVAISGRVPVRVIGQVKKGDRLVSAGNGLARTGLKSEITPFNVIGRALETKTTTGEGTVYAIVKLNS